MNISLSGKTALVGGSTQGIGKATALQMARNGATVIALARNESKLEGLVSELRGISVAPHDYICADFNHPDQLKERVSSSLERIGPVHVLVNNTGGPPGGKAIDARPEEFSAAFAMHLLCNQILVRCVYEGMKSSGYGRIINVISTSVKQPLANLGVSNTVRGAVANWAKTLANELGAFNITVNNVLPGATQTGRLQSIVENKAASQGITPEQALSAMASEVPVRRVAQPEEVAYGICFLASPAASYINGINLPIDGGRTGCL